MTSMLGRAVLGVTRQSYVQRLLRSGPGRTLAKRFVAGETIDEAIDAARALNEAGATVSLDHLGEHVHERSLALKARDDYLACLDRIGTEGIDANISVKLTQLGLGMDDELAAGSLQALEARAAEVGTNVSIDMEESKHTEATIGLYERCQTADGILGVALQSYLRRTERDVERLGGRGGHIRLCKGAYKEPPELAFQRKADVDASFDRSLRLLMANDSVKPAVATHDLARIALTKRLLAKRSGDFEFQMLYGVRNPLQRELLRDGFPLRVYVPYGSAWYPYLTRRLAERPANLWFFVRALFGRS